MTEEIKQAINEEVARRSVGATMFYCEEGVYLRLFSSLSSCWYKARVEGWESVGCQAEELEARFYGVQKEEEPG